MINAGVYLKDNFAVSIKSITFLHSSSTNFLNATNISFIACSYVCFVPLFSIYLPNAYCVHGSTVYSHEKLGYRALNMGIWSTINTADNKIQHNHQKQYRKHYYDRN